MNEKKMYSTILQPIAIPKDLFDGCKRDIKYYAIFWRNKTLASLENIDFSSAMEVRWEGISYFGPVILKDVFGVLLVLHHSVIAVSL